MTLCFFNDPSASDASLFGGKAASLGRLASANRIPPGFCLSVDAYRHWFADGAGEMPVDLCSEISRAYAELEKSCGIDNVPVARITSTLGASAMTRLSFHTLLTARRDLSMYLQIQLSYRQILLWQQSTP